MQTIVLAGTRKGLFIGRSDAERRTWEWDEPRFSFDEVYSCGVDKRGDGLRLFSGNASMWLGAQVHRSDDLGHSWETTPDGGPAFPEEIDAAVKRVWQVVAGTTEGVVYAGVEPGAIFRSDDRGETFGLVRGLWDHPHRTEWNEGFGGQAFHTILPHPTDPQSVVAAISTGGVYRTRDGGSTWTACNQGIRADFMPEDMQYPEFGQCVHKVSRHPERPERLYLQNHGGVYRSDDEGDAWTSIGDEPAVGLRVLHHGAPARARHDLGLPHRWRRQPLPARRQGPRVALPRRRRQLDRARRGTARPVPRRRHA